MYRAVLSSVADYLEFSAGANFIPSCSASDSRSASAQFSRIRPPTTRQQKRKAAEGSRAPSLWCRTVFMRLTVGIWNWTSDERPVVGENQVQNLAELNPFRGSADAVSAYRNPQLVVHSKVGKKPLGFLADLRMLRKKQKEYGRRLSGLSTQNSPRASHEMPERSRCLGACEDSPPAFRLEHGGFLLWLNRAVL